MKIFLKSFNDLINLLKNNVKEKQHDIIFKIEMFKKVQNLNSNKWLNLTTFMADHKL